jgi:hypothetical protein
MCAYIRQARCDAELDAALEQMFQDLKSPF